MFTVSINPTYLCNFRCEYCYLSPAQLSDKTALPTERIDALLDEIQQHQQISHIDIYGGEISATPLLYQSTLYSAIRAHYSGSINVVTNFLRKTPLIEMPGVTLSVSYDFSYRERHGQVYQRMMASKHPMHVLILAVPGLVDGDVDDMITKMNAVSGVVSVEIKPYSTNQANAFTVTHIQYEEFVKRWITSPVVKRFDFINEHEIKRSIYGTRNSFSDDHLYITPSGRFAVLDFDLNDREYFKEMDTFDQYLEWTLQEKHRTFANSYCNQCKYLGSCLTEHIRNVKNVDQSCDGYYKLITWYKNERMESKTAPVS